MSIEYLDKIHARLCVSKGTGENRKRYTKRITYSGKKDAQRQLREFEDSITDQLSRLTVEELVQGYIDEKIALGLKATSIHGYQCCMKRIILSFDGANANDVTLLQVQEFITSEAKEKSYKYVKNVLSLLNSSYKRGVIMGLVENNPCLYAKLPKKKDSETRILEKSVLSDFLFDVDKLHLSMKLTCHLALFCGLRRSEILGLTPQNVNLDLKQIYIKQTRHRVNKKDIIQDTKTESSRRVVQIPDFMLDELKECMNYEYIISNGFGEPVNPNSVSKDFYFMVGKKYGISLHGLRHTHASILHDAGFPLAEISKQLGHSQISTTLDIYTHVFDETSDRRIASAMEKMSPKSHQDKQKTVVSNGLVAEDMGLEFT